MSPDDGQEPDHADVPKDQLTATRVDGAQVAASGRARRAASRPRPSRRDAARNVERVLDAGRLVFKELGPRMTLVDVARRAELSVSTVHRVFARREDLMLGLAELDLTRNFASVISNATARSGPSAKFSSLHELFDCAMLLATPANDESPAFPVTLVRDAVINAGVRHRSSVAPLLSTAQASGEMRSDVINDDIVRVLAMSVSTLDTIRAGDGTDGTGTYRYLELLLHGLLPSSGQALPETLPSLEPLKACGPGLHR